MFSLYLPISLLGAVVQFPYTQRGVVHASPLYTHSLGTASSSPSSFPSSTSFIDATTAQDIDKELMSEEGGFQLEQLMELAGLSVAAAAQVSKRIIDILSE